jgi:hypothetical protein
VVVRRIKQWSVCVVGRVEDGKSGGRGVPSVV